VKKKVNQNSKYKKMINQIKSVCNCGAKKKTGEVAVDLKNLSQLIGGSFWCNSSAKSELRS